ncbi:TlpA family protein disulfide reductase [Niabella sp. CC-SYL272]|uniref:TlpA family protein disulfide reductase n=1 Tax=Niabella agricola TaxID=2891571 RepID=UPI001F182C22|nr:TlpA disulfide reductase family protein [Niabella agricola]MCF3111756.1 TlpA family protein disulfide reductase [Niabella agricola]
MKDSVILVLILLALVGSVGAQKKVVIDGWLKGVEDGTPISLMKEEGSVGTEVAKDSVVNGRFHIEYGPDNEEIGRYSLRSFDKGFPSMGLELWAKPGHHMTIEGQNKLIYTWNVISDIPEQKEWAYFVQANKLLWNNYQELSAIRNIVRSADRSTGLEKKNAQITIDSLDRLSDACLYKIHKRNLDLLQKGRMTSVRLKILDAAANMIKWNHIDAFRTPVAKLYNSLDAHLKNSAYGEHIANVLYPPRVVKVGEPMYDTVLTDLDGKLHRLTEFKGQYILLDFWSFGCGPCHASVPEMKEIFEQLKDRLVIVSLSSDNKKMWKQASEYFKMTWNNFSDGRENRGIYAKYGVEGIPNYVLVAPNGIIKDSWTGYDKGSLKNKIKALTGFSVN